MSANNDQARPYRVNQVNGEELDDEEIIICPTCPARKAVVL
jgi:hypothetical protein